MYGYGTLRKMSSWVGNPGRPPYVIPCGSAGLKKKASRTAKQRHCQDICDSYKASDRICSSSLSFDDKCHSVGRSRKAAAESTEINIWTQSFSYSKALKETGLPSLAARREGIVEKFATKLATNASFARCFPAQKPSTYTLRKEKKYKEEHANTERLYNSPIFFYRRMLNNGMK